VNKLDRLLVSFGRSPEGLSFDSIDDQPAYLFFLLVAPENSAGAHLQALAKISRVLKDSNFRQRLMDAKSKDEIYRIIVEKDREG
jgi:nitrogen PTS system EIIA component